MCSLQFSKQCLWLSQYALCVLKKTETFVMYVFDAANTTFYCQTMFQTMIQI